MYRTTIVFMMLLSTMLLLAGGPSWQSKPIAQWNEQDAKQLLRSSPWVKHAAVSLLFQPSEDQLRAGGNMGGGKGVGLESLEVSSLVGGQHHANTPVKKPGYLIVRWESASPVRQAETKLQDANAPGWDGEYYAVAVYGVPVDAGRLDEPGRAGEMKRLGVLKRDGMKDVKAAKVDITPTGAGLATVLYLFPRSAAISGEEKRIEFAAQFGRIYVAQYFYPHEMQFGGKLEL
ncbi:MAG: hypothetical protein ACLPWF_18570 [Bryobacteraceae bacterium]